MSANERTNEVTGPNRAGNDQAARRRELITLIERQKGLMITVATGGARIQKVNEEYKHRRYEIRDRLTQIGIDDPNPYADLWDWHGKWSGGDLPHYSDRRTHIGTIYTPLLDELQAGSQVMSTGQPEPTGWERVDRGVDKIRKAFRNGNNEEDFQAVGLLCREVLISLAQAIYKPETHQSVAGTAPSGTDAKRMLEAYIAKELAGGPNQAVRKYAKAALDLTNDLQHKRTATFRHASMCMTATVSVVELIAIVSGRRDQASNAS